MRFMHPERDSALELSLDDVFLVPGYFEGLSRHDVSLVPVDFPGSAQPLVSANMNAVTGKRMAETMARYGGLGVLPQDMSLEAMTQIVRFVKDAHPHFDTALEVAPDAVLRDVQGLIMKRAHDMVVVVDPVGRKALGVVTRSDLRERDQYTPVHRLMNTRMVALPEGISYRDAFIKLDTERVKAAPVLDTEGRLKGVLTKDDALRLSLLSPSLDDTGRLMIAAAVGIAEAVEENVERLLTLGVNAIVLDTAHAHQRRMLDALRVARRVIGDQPVPLIAGNVCTPEGTRDLIQAGADIVKVNVGPGAMCTTRMQTGAGRPSFSSVLSCAAAARELGKHVWADGGVRHPRDVALYLAAGASRVMIGTMLAGTYESPGDLRYDPEGALYKENYGMASARAVSDRNATADAFTRAMKGIFREGISTSRVYLREGQESVGDVLMDLLTGVKSAFTYVGATNPDLFFQKAVVGTQTSSGYNEGLPHGKVRK